MEARKKTKTPPAGTKKLSKSAKQPPKKENDPKKALEEELKSLIPRLDEEGLTFLIQQAQVHLYNMQVDELNKTMMRTAPREKAADSSEKAKKNSQELRIEASNDKSSFYLVHSNHWIMLTDEEMIQLVKIASARGVTNAEKTEALYRWLERERTDIFGEIPIEDENDEILLNLIRLIKKTFALRYK
ncbi:hypothetical protein [Breznakiella homolactica]|uniref:Uncharacterized protein n=1 Tax=Breznakiella homolactica TaxID=2798577 RepID=A0A7T7XNV6_9SPIR|nr:hypothetical protein [Breznakiella homolactica]QQO09790.1 hypothetical protein JFL75_02450 [Breznakiella homolactica]